MHNAAFPQQQPNGFVLEDFAPLQAHGSVRSTVRAGQATTLWCSVCLVY